MNRLHEDDLQIRIIPRRFPMSLPIGAYVAVAGGRLRDIYDADQLFNLFKSGGTDT